MEEDKILALVPVPLLDRVSIFDGFRMINLPIPYPNSKQKLVVAKCKLEAEYIAFNHAMLLTKKEAQKCKTDALGTCMSDIHYLGSSTVSG